MKIRVLKIIKWKKDTFSGVRLRLLLINKGGLWPEGVGIGNTDRKKSAWWKIFIQPSNNYKKKVKFKFEQTVFIKRNEMESRWGEGGEISFREGGFEGF